MTPDITEFRELGHQLVDRIATYLKSLDYPEKSHIALFSKNTAYWILADVAIQMSLARASMMFAALIKPSILPPFWVSMNG